MAKRNKMDAPDELVAALVAGEDSPALTLEDALASIQGTAPVEVGVSENVVALIKDIAESKDLQYVLNLRRHVRYRLFHIRKGGRMGEANDMGLKAYMEAQFLPGMTWSNFTFEWDVAPNNPLKIIHRSLGNYEWMDLGGKFINDKKSPPAFTNQE